MRRTRVLIAVVVLGLAGCGGTAWHDSASPQGAAVLLRALDSTTAASTARFTMTIDGSFAGQSVRVDADGVMSFRNGSAQMHMSAKSGSRSVAMEARIVDGKIYVNVGGRWVSKDASSSSAGSAGSDPTQFFEQLRGITDDLHETGHGHVHGDRTTVYSGTLNFDKAADRVDASKRESLRAAARLFSESPSVHVEIDDRGRVRAFDMSINMSAAGESATIDIKMEFWAFGTPLHVIAPSDATEG